MTQPTIAPGIYTFFVGHGDGHNKLFGMYFDGMTMSGPSPCSVSGDPDLTGSPCCLYDAEGVYAGDRLPRVHIFVLAEDNTIWWLSTIDGIEFITHNEDIANVPTGKRFGAVLLGDGIHLYYTDLETSRIAHAWSSTDWTFQATELLLTRNETAAWGVAAVQGDNLYLLFGNGNSQPDQPQNNLQLFCLQAGTGSNDGNGQFVAQGPGWQLDIQLYDTPSATILGENLVVVYKGTGHGGQQAYFSTMSSQDTWSDPAPIPNALTTNSIGSCLYGGRLFCLFQSSSGNDMYLQAFIGRNWLPDAIEVAQNNPRVFWGPAAVAVERGAAR